MRKYILTTLLALVVQGLIAQSYIEYFPPVSLPNTQTHTLYSPVVKENYKLYIALPVDYDSSPAKKFPVLYLLDADYSFALAKNISDHLNERNNLEGIILVGIAYAGPNNYRVNRTRDYTPHYSPDGGYNEEVQKNSGGGPAFLKFMETELFPYIESKFRTSGERGLSGHSYGGLFASWVLIHKPSTFQKYIIVSPSLWFDNRYMFALEKENFEKNKSIQARVYMSVGATENPMMPNDLSAFAKQLHEHAYSNLSLDWTIEAGQNHNTVFPIALTKGLRFVYANE